SSFVAFGWLQKGYEDFMIAPLQSATYGFVISLFVYVLAYMAYVYGSLPFVLLLGAGVMFLGPVLAFGLYSISRQIGMGLEPKLGYCLQEGRRHLGNELVFAIVLLVVFLVWARSASIIHIFFPTKSDAGISEYALFLGIGSLVGSFFLALTFMLSAFSLPMFMDKKVDVVTAVLTSVNAVLHNKKALLVWAGLIFIASLLSLVSFLLGLIVILPILGHATWYAYKDTIDASAWPDNESVE
ncbi:MAG: DUF2189 domain-containing protein, partial [Gammaproteobacteria bacterium]|nr:DUF2189 domain-containing protein [Gammaproteobacteria bacterium]